MKVYIDVTVLTLATFVTGIQRVTREVAVRLIQDVRFEIVLIHYNAKKNCYYQIDNEKFCEYYCKHLGIKEMMITRREVPLKEIGKGTSFFDLDASWMSRVKRSYLLPILKNQGARIIAHIYDIISINYPQFCLGRGVYNFMDYIGAHIQYADAIIVNAQATKNDLMRLGERTNVIIPPCYVVPLGADFGTQRTISDTEVPDKLIKVVSEFPYILMVGTIEPRKNHKLLLEAYDKGLREMGYNIIFAGYMGWKMEEFQNRLVNHPDYGKRIFHFSGLDDVSIIYLYQHARFLAFCSYTEGFGLPIIEAIAKGTPVIAADVEVLKEVAEGCCVWFEQDNVEMLCNLIRKYEDEELYSSLKAEMKKSRFVTWEESAGFYKNVLGQFDNL